MRAFTESVVEVAALAWLAGVGWQVRYLSFGEPAEEHDEYRQLVQPQYVRDALLQQPISSELRVQEADRAIKRATI